MEFSKTGIARAAAAAGLLLLVPVGLLAQSEDDRRRAVGDWLIEDVSDQDGRVIHLTREEGDYRIKYDIWLRPGETTPGAHGFEVDRLNCAQGMSESTGGPDDTPIEVAPIRARLVEYLERCDAPASEIAGLLQGYERAFAVARSWADERLAQLSDEASAASAAYENDMMLDMNATDMAMDMNATTDTNTATDMSDMSYADMNMSDCGCEGTITNAVDDAVAAAEAAADAAEAAANAAEPK